MLRPALVLLAAPAARAGTFEPPPGKVYRAATATKLIRAELRKPRHRGRP